MGDGGYCARFSEVVSASLHCPICLAVCREAVMIPLCCHTFCRGCLNRLSATMGAALLCPVDRQEFMMEGVINARNVDRQIMELPVRCGTCAWDGVLSGLEAHNLECPMVLLQRQNAYLREQLSTIYGLLVGVHAFLGLEPQITSPMPVANLSAVPAVPTGVDFVVEELAPPMMDDTLPTSPVFPGSVVAEYFRQLVLPDIIDVDST